MNRIIFFAHCAKYFSIDPSYSKMYTVIYAVRRTVYVMLYQKQFWICILKKKSRICVFHRYFAYVPLSIDNGTIFLVFKNAKLFFFKYIFYDFFLFLSVRFKYLNEKFCTYKYRSEFKDI